MMALNEAHCTFRLIL